MKSKKEMVLEYFAGILEDEELFLKKLESDSELAAEYEKVRKQLEKTQELKNSEISEHYYSLLLPRVRASIDAGKSLQGLRGIVYSLSGVMAAVLFFFILDFGTAAPVTSEELFDDIINQFEEEEILTVLNENYSAVKYGLEGLEDLSYENIISGIEADDEYLYDPEGVSSIYSDDYIENISEEELEVILEQLENKKYF